MCRAECFIIFFLLFIFTFPERERGRGGKSHGFPVPGFIFFHLSAAVSRLVFVEMEVRGLTRWLRDNDG